jgi:hypothetical protein
VIYQLLDSVLIICKQGYKIEYLQVDGVPINDDQKIANHLNAQFLESVPSLDNVNTDYEDWNINKDEEFHLAPCCDTEIVDIITEFKAKNSTSWDGISTRVLKRISKLIAAPLSYLANESFSQGVFPDNLKTNELTHVYKKGEHCDPQNNRPIAMASLLEPCAVAGVVLKNRNTAHQNRGCGLIFGIFYQAVQFCSCGFGTAVVVLQQKPRLHT